ncbi:MAG: hypothetical protein NXH85_17285 [Pseudomonadaceae bacterium]|nr:hypothetical protein [Pseudomonadaceae bacterium]
METLASVVPPGLNWVVSLALVACATVISIGEVLRRRLRDTRQRRVLHTLARCWLGISGLSGVELPQRARQTLAVLLNEALAAHFPATSSDWLSAERGRIRGLYNHQPASVDYGKLTRAQRRHAMASLNVLIGVLDELAGQNSETEGARLAALAQIRGLRTRLKADQLKHQAVYAGHLGETVMSARAYQQALTLLEAEPHIARPNEIAALRSHIEQASAAKGAANLVRQPA